MTQVSTSLPTTDIDLFSDEVLAVNDDSVLGQLRELGPVVYVPANDAYAITTYDAVRAAAGDPETFSSHQVAFNPKMNEMLSGTSLVTDPPDHAALRAVLTDNLSPRALRRMKTSIFEKADAMVADCFARDSFEAMADLAVALPVSIVLDLIGVQGEKREHILPWGEAAFNLLGPMNERAQAAFPVAGELFHWTHEEMRGEELADGSIGRNIWEAAERGEIGHDAFGFIVHQILAAGMDTTITTIGNILLLLGQHPDQFALLRESPDRAAAVIAEVMRHRTPTPVFGRVTTREVDVAGFTIPAGSQIALLYGAANMDPAHYPNPTAFDITRNPVDHLGFGYGIHGCAGQGLAKLEMTGLVTALARRVQSYGVGEVEVRLNNFTRPYHSIEIKDIELASES